VIDIGPGAGEDGGTVVATGKPSEVARVKHSKTAPYLARFLAETSPAGAGGGTAAHPGSGQRRRRTS
jgi:hypothetical protein